MALASALDNQDCVGADGSQRLMVGAGIDHRAGHGGPGPDSYGNIQKGPVALLRSVSAQRLAGKLAGLFLHEVL
jgi:hypothetical protein